MDERWSEETEEVAQALRKMLRTESAPARVRAAEDAPDGRDLALETALAAFGLAEIAGDPALLARAAFELGRALTPATFVETTPARVVLGRDGVAYGFEGDTPAALGLVAVRADDGGVCIDRVRAAPRRTAAGDWLMRHTPTGQGERVGDAVAADKMWRLMRLVDSARLIGASEALLELGVAYAKERVQFGKPIGAFQAVAHRLVDARIALDGADLLLRKAANVSGSALGGDGAPATPFAIMLRAKAVQTARRVAASVHQVFGGNGFSLDYDCQLYSRRLRGWAMRLGRPGPELAALARIMLDPAQRDRIRWLWHHDTGLPLPRWAREADMSG